MNKKSGSDEKFKIRNKIVIKTIKNPNNKNEVNFTIEVSLNKK